MTRALLACLALVVTAACGTTVPAAQQADSLNNGLGTPTTQSGSQPGAATTAATGLTPAQVRAAGTSAAQAQAQAEAHQQGQLVSGAVASGVPAKGRGWDQHTIWIGVLTQKDFEKTFASVGYSGIDPGDTAAQAQAVVDQVNRAGGVLGRKVVIKTYDVPTLSSAQNPDQAGQEVCTYFTQDQPVVAVFNVIHTVDKTTFRSCLAQRHVPLFNAALSVVSRADAAKLAPYFYSLGTPTWDVLAPVLVQRLRAQGYFSGWDARLGQPSPATPPVVGVLVADSPLGHADEAIITANLKAAGYTKVVTFAYPPPGSDIDGAVLNFAQNGVTHVISDDIELVTFQIHAQGQNYRPRYGIHTYNAPSANLEALGPKSQQVGEVGVGWGPTFDVSAGNDPGAFDSGVTACKTAMDKEHVTSSDRLAEADALLVCDAIRFGVAGMLTGHGLTAAQMFAGAVREGRSFAPAFTFSAGFTSNRLFLPASVRDLAWNVGCSCFRYVGSTRTRM